MSEIVEVKATDYGLEEKKGKELTSGLTQIIEERQTLEAQYSELIKGELSPELSAQAKALRLMIRDNRTKGIEVWHTANKAFFLYGGKFVDATKNKEIAVNNRMEKKLLEIEKHQENLEKERMQKVKESRVKELTKFGRQDDPVQVELMTDDVWENYISGVELAYKKAKEDEAKAIAAEKEAERKNLLHTSRKDNLLNIWTYVNDDHKFENFGELSEENYNIIYNEAVSAKEADEKYQKAQRIENQRLKKEADERESKAEAERKEREKKEAAEKAEADKKLADERKEKEEALAKLKAQEEAKAKADADAIKKAEDIANASDAEKVKGLKSELEGIKTKYLFKSKKNQKMHEDVNNLIDKIVAHINK